MQQDVYVKYHTSQPNLFVMLGTDVMVSGANGATLAQFRINAGGLTFPLLRDCADGSALSDTNLIKPYNQRDNYVVIDANGVIRYHADDFWDYGGRLHLDELYAAIDGALGVILAVPPGASGALALRASPNPSSGRVAFALSNTSGAARFRVLDLAGRQLAVIEAVATSGSGAHAIWDGRAADGRALPAGLYLVRAESAGHSLTQRIVLTR